MDLAGLLVRERLPGDKFEEARSSSPCVVCLDDRADMIGAFTVRLASWSALDMESGHGLSPHRGFGAFLRGTTALDKNPTTFFVTRSRMYIIRCVPGHGALSEH